MSKVLRLAKEREMHWIRCKRVLGMIEEHDYNYRCLVEEAIKEAADMFNYLTRAGYDDLALEAVALGDKIAAKVDASRGG